MTGAVLLYQILPETGWQPGENHLEDSDSFWTSYRLRSGTTGLKMAAHRWIVSHALTGLQQAKMTRSLLKWTPWWCEILCDYPSNCWRGGHQQIPFWSKIWPWRVATKFVPKLPTAKQKQLCVEVSQDMLDSTNSDFWHTCVWRFKSPHASALHWKPPGFRKKKSDTFLTDYVLTKNV